MTADWDNEVTQPMPAAPPAPPLPMQLSEKLRTFGAFNFTATPVPGNPEHITIAGNWVGQNIESFQVPQLAGRRVSMHRLVVAQFLRLWAAWEAAGLRNRIVTFDGGYNPRYKRKRALRPDGTAAGVEALSNHSWGSAFDTNASLLPLGRPCPPIGTHGCTSELVPLAHEHGFVNGDQFHAPWQDPMHFECYRVIP